MKLTGLHLLLSYQCTFECDHCFVFGSPWQQGVMTLPQIENILAQGKALGTVNSIYFEGGEPFLYYATLVKGVQAAAALGFSVGIVSNAYWATSLPDALEALRPLAGLVGDLTVSSDLFHYSEAASRQVQNAAQAAEQLGIPTGTISVAQPVEDACASSGQIQHGGSQVMYRGRAVEKLAGKAPKLPWQGFNECSHEDLRDPGRVHVDPFGNLHVCQGITIGNLFEEPLGEIVARYDPDRHPIVGPILRGGPAGLVSEYSLPEYTLLVAEEYADACHLCYESRRMLRESFPAELAPDGMYGIYD
jgi:MoaA/NifB/PqqE/SkfB family radical SAM enzyme